MLISLHLPKTAGASFRRALEAHFGPKLLRDYADYPINTPVYERCLAALRASIDIAERGVEDTTCIHGHFLPLKYLLLSTKQEVTFVTWMRNPVERVLSHYYYWKRRSYNPQDAPLLHRKVIEEEWSIERFSLNPELRNLYSQFLWGFPLELFDFIGITEFYEEDLLYFSQTYLGVPLEAYKKNIGDKREKHYDIDQEFRQQIVKYHARDMELYKRAQNKRLTRLS